MRFSPLSGGEETDSPATPASRSVAAGLSGDIMLREIYEQPAAVLSTLRDWIDHPGALLDELGIARMVKALRRLHIVACGSSYHAGLVGRYLIEKFVRIPVNVDIASEYQYVGPTVTTGTLLVSISRSGETGDTLAAQRVARENGALALTICNMAGSTAAREADSVLYTKAGAEAGVTSTKTFSAQMAALSLFGMALGVRKEKLTSLEIQTMRSFLAELPSLIEKVLRTDGAIRSIAGTLLDATSVLYFGKGINYPIALEGALKMREVASIHASGFATGEMNHGPIALIKKGVPVIFLLPVASLHERTLATLRELKARGARIIGITDSPAALRENVDDLIVIPASHPALLPFLTIVPLQLLAYHVATLKGCDVDEPKNVTSCDRSTSFPPCPVPAEKGNLHPLPG